jgi:hypothetical protein
VFLLFRVYGYGTMCLNWVRGAIAAKLRAGRSCCLPCFDMAQVTNKPSVEEWAIRGIGCERSGGGLSIEQQQQRANSKTKFGSEEGSPVTFLPFPRFPLQECTYCHKTGNLGMEGQKRSNQILVPTVERLAIHRVVERCVHYTYVVSTHKTDSLRPPCPNPSTHPPPTPRNGGPPLNRASFEVQARVRRRSANRRHIHKLPAVGDDGRAELHQMQPQILRCFRGGKIASRIPLALFDRL